MKSPQVLLHLSRSPDWSACIRFFIFASPSGQRQVHLLSPDVLVCFQCHCLFKLTWLKQNSGSSLQSDSPHGLGCRWHHTLYSFRFGAQTAFWLTCSSFLLRSYFPSPIFYSWFIWLVGFKIKISLECVPFLHSLFHHLSPDPHPLSYRWFQKACRIQFQSVLWTSLVQRCIRDVTLWVKNLPHPLASLHIK